MVFVIFVLLVEVGFFIIIALHYDQGRLMLKDQLISQMKNYDHLHPSSYERAVDAIQNRVWFMFMSFFSLSYLSLSLSFFLEVSLLWNRFGLRLRNVSCSSFMLHDGFDDVVYGSSSGFNGNTGLRLLVGWIEFLLGKVLPRLPIRSVDPRRKSWRHPISRRSTFLFSVHWDFLGDLPLPVQYDLRWLHPNFLLCLTNSEKMLIALLRFDLSKLNFVSWRKWISTKDSIRPVALPWLVFVATRPSSPDTYTNRPMLHWNSCSTADEEIVPRREEIEADWLELNRWCRLWGKRLDLPPLLRVIFPKDVLESRTPRCEWPADSLTTPRRSTRIR